ncbi:AAC(3) family N-acetyltransferase [Negadavirga shengliensis]|uniref:Aminoglycoside N(3)-acetyltransferase n=1 Tax=Negadavirga shengliensis TaxID=1389218 RepID=A0ABV9SZE4_9BACT
MNPTVSKIKEDIRKLGISEGDSLLVHASLNAVGRFQNRTEVLIDAFLEVLGPDGTLLMPALSYKTVTRENPVFDVRQTPSCVGALTEYFRTMPGVERSIHPTHSVSAIGRRAGWFVEDHLEDDTPCGSHSPFAKLKEVNGRVMFLGCGPKPNTSMHAIEELVVPPYLFGDPVVYTLHLADGKTIDKAYIRHGFQGYEQRYDRLLDVLDKQDYRCGKVLEADTITVDSVSMWDKAEKKLSQDPLYFVDKV